MCGLYNYIRRTIRLILLTVLIKLSCLETALLDRKQIK